MRKVTGILIDPFACTVSQVEHDAEDYRDIYRLLSHESMPVECFTTAYVEGLLADGDAIFVDDEGLLKHCERFFRLPGGSQWLAGKGLILGANEEGETVSAHTEIDAIKNAVSFSEMFKGSLWLVDKPWAATNQPNTGE